MSIDLHFRPAHYADFDDPVALALNGIKGQMRRVMVRDMLSAEGDKRGSPKAEQESLERVAGEHERGIESLPLRVLNDAVVN